MSDMKNMGEIAKEAVEAAKTALGVRANKDVIDMCGSDVECVSRLTDALLRWDAARLEAAGRRFEAESKLKQQDK